MGCTGYVNLVHPMFFNDYFITALIIYCCILCLLSNFIETALSYSNSK